MRCIENPEAVLQLCSCERAQGDQQGRHTRLTETSHSMLHMCRRKELVSCWWVGGGRVSHDPRTNEMAPSNHRALSSGRARQQPR